MIRYTAAHIDEACDELATILTAALDRLDKGALRQYRQREETTCGTCWETLNLTSTVREAA